MNPTSHESITGDRLNNSLYSGNDQVENTSTHPTTNSASNSVNSAVYNATTGQHSTGGLTSLNNTHHVEKGSTGHHTGSNHLNNFTGNHTGSNSLNKHTVDHNGISNVVTNSQSHHVGINPTSHQTGSNVLDSHAGNHTSNHFGINNGTNPLNKHIDNHSRATNVSLNSSDHHTNENSLGHHNGSIVSETGSNVNAGIHSTSNNLTGHNGTHTATDSLVGSHNHNNHHVGTNSAANSHTHADPGLRESYALAGDGLAPQMAGLFKGKSDHVPATSSHHLTDKNHTGTHTSNHNILNSSNDHHLNTTTGAHNSNVLGQTTATPHVAGHNIHSTKVGENPNIPSNIKPSKIGGTMDKLKGSVQETLGKVTNNANLLETGHENKLEGQAKIEAAKLEKERKQALH